MGDTVADAGMQVHRGRLFAAFPQARAIDTALASAANRTPLFYMQRAQDADLQGAWWALGRLGPMIERQFNINGEVLFVFTPWRDFQTRAYNAITQRLFSEVRSVQETDRGERFTPDRKIVIVATPDPKADGNIAAWNRGDSPTRVVHIPQSTQETDQLAELIGALATTLSRRDLYSGKNPVTGDDFFGRRGLLEELAAQVENNQNVALLGFRRSGKTSVLLELRRRMMPKQTVFSISDLEPVGKLGRMPGIIAGDLLDALRIAKSAGQSVWIGSEPEQNEKINDYAQLSARLRRVAERNSDHRFVIAIDEIESLTPFMRNDPQSVRSLLGSLRAAAQSSSNVSLIFTGVANRIFVRSTLGGGFDNPVFGFVESSYLRPFDAIETAELLRTLGEPMLLEWSDTAVSFVQELTGGLPYFVRSIGSAVRSLVEESSEGPRSLQPVQIDAEAVSRAVNTWSQVAAAEWRGIVESLSIHYTGAAELLESQDDEELGTWLTNDSELEETALVLEQLGLIARIDGGYSLSESLKSMRALAAPAVSAKKPGMIRAESMEIAEIIRQGETHQVEFKQTARINVWTGEKDAKMEDEVVKTVAAFLNSDGGQLLVGVSDDGSIHGIEDDVNATKNRDYFLQWVTGSLLSERLGKAIVSRHVRLNPTEVESKEVLVIQVTPSHEPVWAKYGKDARLYVRNGNHTLQLTGNEITDFIRNRTAP